MKLVDAAIVTIKKIATTASDVKKDITKDKNTKESYEVQNAFEYVISFFHLAWLIRSSL